MIASFDTDLQAEITSSVRGILNTSTGPAAGPGHVDRRLRDALGAAGFLRLGVPEAAGGSGGRLSDLALVVSLLAQHGAQVPLGEESFLAAWLLNDGRLSMPAGITVAALDEAEGELVDGALSVNGTLATPWARHAEHVAVLVRCADDSRRVALLRLRSEWVREAENLAGEPRDTLVLTSVEAEAGSHGPVTLEAHSLVERAALLRAVQLAGASEGVMTQTLAYVGEREQFGRPLNRFQAVQHQLAAMAAEVSIMHMAAATAVSAAESAESDPALVPTTRLAVAAAKATNSASAQIVARIGHQLHGALGYSHEHVLGSLTSRLWSWREESGNEGAWQDRLGAAVLAAEGWWPTITGSPSSPSRGRPQPAGGPR